MARSNRTGYRWLRWGLVIGLPLAGLAYAGLKIGWGTLGLSIAGCLALLIALVWLYRFNRRRRLLNKYQDPKLVEALLEQRFWEGQTAEQLLDALGEPHDIDQKVLKTKKKEIWKYDHSGRNRYQLRITLDNDLVVGWDQKD